MHSEIKEFWETAGYEVKVHILQGEMAGLDDLMANDLWYAHKGFDELLIADTSRLKTRRDYYYFNNKSYSELKMLRLVRLKALL